MTKSDHAPIKVTATAKGFYGEKMRQPGDEFEISELREFSFFWMRSDDARILTLDAPLTTERASV